MIGRGLWRHTLKSIPECVTIVSKPMEHQSVSPTEVKEFYRTYNDPMNDARYESPYRMRSYAHNTRNKKLLALLKPGQRMLEIGAGDGVFAVSAAKKGLT